MDHLSILLLEYGYITDGKIDDYHRAIILFALAAICLAVFLLLKKGIFPILQRIVAKTAITWDDHLLNTKVLNAASYLIPAVICYAVLPTAFIDKPFVAEVADKVCNIVIIALCVKLVNAFISSFYNISNDSDKMRHRPLKGFYQMLRVVAFAIGAILIISIIIDQRPGMLLTGIGASAAVLMLVFKDTIMGLVAGVQINAYDTLRPGDWIIMDKYGANGEVIEVTLNLVKVLNWDNSIVTVPSFLFLSESFHNMRKMRELKSRRIKEQILIDIDSVHFCSDDETVRFRKIARQPGKKDDTADEFTNLHYYRFFLEKYLSENSDITPKPHLMVRHIPASPHGMTIEIYCFTKETAWIPYEHVKAAILEFAYASLPRFGLRAFQSPASADIRHIAGK